MSQVYTLEERIQALKGCRLFESLPRESLRLLAITARQVQCPAGDTLIERGEEGDHAFVVVAGEAAALGATEQTGEVLLARFGPGQIVGEISVLARIPRTATVRVEQDLSALKITRQDLFELLQVYPEVSLAFMELLVERLLEIRQKYLALAGSDG